MLHQTSKIYENHHLDILDHLDNHHDDVHSSQYYKNISSTSSPEPQHGMQPIQQFRVIKDGRQMYEDGYRVSSSDLLDHQMGPPPTPSKSMKIISSEEPTSSMPDLGELTTNFFWLIEKTFQTKSINLPIQRAIFPENPPRHSRF